VAICLDNESQVVQDFSRSLFDEDGAGCSLVNRRKRRLHPRANYTGGSWREEHAGILAQRLTGTTQARPWWVATPKTRKRVSDMNLPMLQDV
jgi:hypothetical protein